MASLRFQHILIDVYLLWKARRLFKFTLLPTPFITLPKVWALDRWTWESEETFWRRRQTSSPGSRKLSSWFCSSLVLPAALRCGKSQSQIKRSNICQGVQFTEQIESCLQLTHATPRIHSFFKDIALEKLAVLPLKLLFLQKEGTLYKNSLAAPFLTKYNSQNWLPWLYYCLFCCALS